MVLRIALVAAGGALGTALRYGLFLAVPVHGDAFPWTTLGVNVSGAFLLGVVVARCAAAPRARLLLGTGVLGAYTTFSTLAVELVLRAGDGRVGLAAGYAVVTVTAGVAAAVAGTAAAGRTAAA